MKVVLVIVTAGSSWFSSPEVKIESWPSSYEQCEAITKAIQKALIEGNINQRLYCHLVMPSDTTESIIAYYKSGRAD